MLKTVPENGKVTGWRKFRFILKRIFPPAKVIRYRYQAAADHPILIPFYYVVRIVDGLSRKKKRARAELKAVMDYREED